MSKINNLDTHYKDLLYNIMRNGTQKGDRTGTGTISVFGREIRHDMRHGFPLLTTKKMFLRGIAVELEWFLRGMTNIKYLVDRNVHIWNGDAYKNYEKRCIPGTGKKMTMQEFVEAIKTDDKFAHTFGELGPIYGHQWRNQGGDFRSADGQFSYLASKKGVDQLADAVQTLLTNPDDRRIKVDAWKADEIKYMALPPCHTDFQFYTRDLTRREREEIYMRRHPSYVLAEGSLDMHNIPTKGVSLKWQQRSVDTFLGLPFNIASYGLLLMIVGQQVNMEPLELIGSLGDTHIYNNHVEQVEFQLGQASYDLPTLEISPEATIDNFEWSMCTLKNYVSGPKIEAPLSN